METPSSNHNFESEIRQINKEMGAHYSHQPRFNHKLSNFLQLRSNQKSAEPCSCQLGQESRERERDKLGESEQVENEI